MRALTSRLSSDWSQRPFSSLIGHQFPEIKVFSSYPKKTSYGFSRLEEVGHSSQNQKCQQSVVKMLRQLCGQ